jgi:hypothetical protein
MLHDRDRIFRNLYGMRCSLSPWGEGWGEGMGSHA